VPIPSLLDGSIDLSLLKARRAVQSNFARRGRCAKSGFAHKEWLEKDTDLDPIRDTDRFRELVGSLG
jgi:hypothetical protein